MTTETMNICKALSTLKVLDSRINQALNEVVACVANKNNNDKIKGVKIDEYKTIMKSNYDKAMDLINRREAIKKAVVLSNAKTIVNIAGNDYTVAEAIEMKNHGVEYKKYMLNTLRDQYARCQNIIAKGNFDADDKAEQYILGLFGNVEKKVANDEIEKVKNTFLQQNQYSLIDPLGVLDKINELESEITSFEAEVDSCISTSNAMTVIEISY